MTTAVEFQGLVDKAVTNLGRFDGIVNGSDTLDVTTDNGPVPSVAKAVKTITDLTADLEDFHDAIETVAGLETEILAVPGQLAAAQDAAADATAAAIDAAASETAAGIIVAGLVYNYVSTLSALRGISTVVAAASPNAVLRTFAGTIGDGAAGFFVYDSADSRADDGATIINPTGNVGSGRWNRLITDHISINWWDPPINQTGDAGAAIRSAIAAAVTWKVREIRFFGKLRITTPICNATYGWELPGGLTFRGVGQQIGLGGGSGNEYSVWLYDGSANTDMFDIRGADGTGAAGTTSNIVFEDMEIAAAADTGFMSINLLRRGGASYTPGVSTFPNFAQNIVFRNIKASGHFDRWFLAARNCFEIIVDDDCHIMNFLRGVQLSGSDDCYVGGRYEGNASRHIMVEKQGTYGNSNKLKPNFLGPHGGSDVTEDHYAIYDTGESTLMESLYAELDGSVVDAILYIGGNACRVVCPKMYCISTLSPAPYFRLGPFAVNCIMICPDSTVANTISHPIIDAQDSSTFFSSGAYDNYNIKIIHPSTSVTARVNTDPRCQIIGGSNGTVAGWNRSPLPAMGLSVNGPGVARYQISAQDLGLAAPIAAGMTGIVVDTSVGNAYQQAIQMPTTNGDGITLDFVCNRDFAAGDQLKFLAQVRCTTTPGAGNLTLDIRKNGVSQTSINTTANTYVTLSRTLDTTGYSTGDVVRIVVTNNGMSVAGLIAMVEMINTSH